VSDGVQILMGRDEMLLGALACGVKAAVGSTYNYAAPVYQRIFDAVAQGDLDAARVANVEAVMFVKALLAAGVLPGAKAIMGWMGVDVGGPRPPHNTLDTNAARVFHGTIANMRVFARPLQP
jgi:N-acetylneuraminate lyase